jgi:hypothetical protein
VIFKNIFLLRKNVVMDVSIANAPGNVEWLATENPARRPARKHSLVVTTALDFAGRCAPISAGSATGAS